MSANDLPADKLRRLIPLLGSPVDAEVVATARAIERVLATAGADWHDLAAMVTTLRPAQPIRTRRPRPGPHDADAVKAHKAMLERVALAMAGNPDGRRLAPWEQGFLRSINDQIHRLGTPLTDKQLAALQRIHDRVVL